MKGTMFDILFIIIAFIALVMTLPIIYRFSTGLEEGLSDAGIETENMEKANASIAYLINSIPVVLLILAISSFVLAWKIPAHPILAPISFILLIIFVVLSAMATNVLYNFSTNTYMIGIFNQYPLLVHVMIYLPYFVAVFGVVLIIVQYSKAGSVHDTY